MSKEISQCHVGHIIYMDWIKEVYGSVGGDTNKTRQNTVLKAYKMHISHCTDCYLLWKENPYLPLHRKLIFIIRGAITNIKKMLGIPLNDDEGWEPISTDEDVVILISALNSDPEVKIEARCSLCQKTWEPGHKCEDGEVK